MLQHEHVSVQTSVETSCPACRSGRLRHLPHSRITGRQVLACRTCGLRALADRAALRLRPEGPSADNLEYDYAAYVSVMRESATVADRERVLTRLEQLTRGRPERSLFDLGAGDGLFCSQARDFGFAAVGNELSPEAVNLAKERYDVALSLGTLDELGLENAHDVLTMWCVLAHVEDNDGLLADSFRLLKPGGVLYLQTPRFTAADWAAAAALMMSNGRAPGLVDARISEKHWQLHTPRSIAALLRRHGFVDVQAIPRARFSLTSDFYLRSFGMPERFVGPASRAMDYAIERGAAPRIVLDVYARKPSV